MTVVGGGLAGPEAAWSLARAAVVATGPLTSDALSGAIRSALGDAGLSFFDAISPIVSGESVDRSEAFPAGRFGESDDYLNCPLDREAYGRFVAALKEADVYPGHDWEGVPYFEGCLPIEVLVGRGDEMEDAGLGKVPPDRPTADAAGPPAGGLPAPEIRRPTARAHPSPPHREARS